MTANETAEQVMRLLGYVNNLGFTNDSDLRARIIPQINSIYADLWYMSGQGNKGKKTVPFKPVVNMDDEINLPDYLINDCFIYGVCMSVAAAESDGEQQQYYAAIYNNQRGKCTHFDSIEDVLPDVWY